MSFHSKLEDEIKHLQNELFMARSLIVELMPLEVQQALYDFYNCQSRSQLHQLRELTINKLIEIAGDKPDKVIHDLISSTHRAYCPLCGGSAHSTYGADGFALPEGLRRHLNGSYNSQRCPVFEEIRKHSIDHIKMIEDRQESLRLEEQRATKSKHKKSPPPLKI